MVIIYHLQKFHPFPQILSFNSSDGVGFENIVVKKKKCW